METKRRRNHDDEVTPLNSTMTQQSDDTSHRKRKVYDFHFLLIVVLCASSFLFQLQWSSLSNLHKTITYSDAPLAPNAIQRTNGLKPQQTNASSVKSIAVPVVQDENVAEEMSGPERRSLARKLKERAPIFCAGLPKSGTTSLHKYFNSLNMRSVFRSSHTFGKRNNTRPWTGVCMQDNWKAGRPMLENCGYYQAWSDSGYAESKDCFYALWHALEDFYRDYPNATIVLNVRNATDWVDSFHAWNGGGLAQRWHMCRNKPSLPKSMQTEKWIEFYNEYNRRIRAFCQDHPSLTCVEFEIEDPRAGDILEQHFGIPSSNWKQCAPGICKTLDNSSQLQ